VSAEVNVKFVKKQTKTKMFSSFTKKKLTDNQVANVFINGIFDSVDKGFAEVAAMINEDSAFVVSPNIAPSDSAHFGLIIVVGNLSFLESTFEPDQAARVEQLIFEKLARVYEMELYAFQQMIRDYQSFIMRVNHPSKNWIYGMSKAIFHKYELYEYQDDYFKKMQAPNPLFLKRMDEIVSNFVWDWDAFFKKFRL
jgi:hypothetical protein